MADIWMSGSRLTKDDRIEIIQQIKMDIQQHQQNQNRNEAPLITSPSPSGRRFSNSSIQNIKMILQLPQDNRIQALNQYGPKSFPLLKELFFNKKETLNIRWISLTSMARLYPKDSLPLISGALKSSVWFLRNVGLVALEIVDPPQAVRWAGRLLNDPSLVVRTAAVQMIQKHKAREYKAQLQEKLNAKDSFLKNESLWIRHHIVSTLASFAQPGEEHYFIPLLQDQDTRVQHSAIRALEKITGKKYYTENNPDPL